MGTVRAVSSPRFAFPTETPLWTLDNILDESRGKRDWLDGDKDKEGLGGDIHGSLPSGDLDPQLTWNMVRILPVFYRML